jgi:hypothetical protein
VDSITRLALSRYPVARRRELELLWYALRQKHARPSEQIREFQRLADIRVRDAS